MLEIVFGWLGILGGLLTAAGDLLLDIKGRDNKKLGKLGFIESAWDNMAEWRFKASIMLAAAGVPLYFLGLTSLAMQMTNAAFALAFWLVCLAGSVGGFFIHALTCIFPIQYKEMRRSQTFEQPESVLNAAYEAVKIPFFIQFCLLVLGSSLMFAAAVILGYLRLPIWTVALTHLCLMIAGILLRILKKNLFYDLPGIVMPSTGLSLLGLMAVINATM